MHVRGFRVQDRVRQGIEFDPEEKRTEEAHAEDTEIHNIIARYYKTGVLAHNQVHEGTYGEYPAPDRFHTAMNIIADANSMFESLPSQLRLDMNNDPVVFLEFMQDPANKDAIEAYGLTTTHLEDVSIQPVPTTQPSEPEAPAEPPAPSPTDADM